MFSHLGGLFLSFLVPLVVYLVCKDSGEQPLATQNAREALNFQITIAMALLVLSFVFPFAGWLLIPAVLLLDLVCCLIATIKATNGETWQYPITLRLIK